MNKIEKGKTALIFISIVIIIVGGLLIWGGVALLGNATWYNIIFAIILFILSLCAIVFGLLTLWTALALNATKGNKMSENDLAKQSNIVLCPKCGVQVNPKDAFCHKCGMSLSAKKICKCGAENNINNRKCTSCGATLD